MQPETGFTAVVADGFALVSEGLAALCEGIPGCTVLGQCTDGEEAWSMILRMQPHIALLDSNLPQMVTTELLRRCVQSEIRTRRIVLAPRPDRKHVMDCLRAGASGYMLKSATARCLEDVFRQVLSGSICVSPAAELQRIVEDGDIEIDGPLGSLSAREHQVFCLLVEGIRAKEIATRLALSPKTVDTYRASLMRKLAIHDVPGLVKYAIQHKVTELS
jgi:DNA-binding NarL/FixJ family response regulator